MADRKSVSSMPTIQYRVTFGIAPNHSSGVNAMFYTHVQQLNQVKGCDTLGARERHGQERVQERAQNTRPLTARNSKEVCMELEVPISEAPVEAVPASASAHEAVVDVAPNAEAGDVDMEAPAAAIEPIPPKSPVIEAVEPAPAPLTRDTPSVRVHISWMYAVDTLAAMLLERAPVNCPVFAVVCVPVA